VCVRRASDKFQGRSSVNKTLSVLCVVVGIVLMGLTLRGGASGALSMIAGAIIFVLGVIMLIRGRR
jgi:hypothetical protein